MRGKQEARRDSKAMKAASRKRGHKLEKAIKHAAIRERKREKRGKGLPSGEHLHTGERLHARKLAKAAVRRNAAASSSSARR